MCIRQGVAILMIPVLLAPVRGETQAGCPKIDVHQHANPLSGYTVNPLGPSNLLRILCPNDRVPCDNPASRFTTDEALLEGTLEYMRRHNVVRAYVSSDDLRLLRRWTRTAPDRFVAGFTLDNAAPSADSPRAITAPPVETLRQAFKRNEYHLLGEIGSQYSGLAPNDKSLDPYFALAEELDIPALIHTAGIGARVPTFHVADGDPLLLEDVLTKHRGLRLYVENAGYPFADQMIAMLYMYPQLYADLSTITWLIPREAFHDYLRRLVHAGFVDRLMFGSDQMAWPETIGMAVEAIESADFLTADHRCDIFFNNAVRFFRLDGEALRKSSWR